MKSSSGEHFIALDHVRAMAAFLVFTWHFTHAAHGYPVPFEHVPSLFFFSLLGEGHTGVALFMTLSGYLFAKILDGRRINYKSFFLNRFLRLAPLLAVVLILAGLEAHFIGHGLSPFAASVAGGVLLPTLPNGGWSITVEMHFYILLPLFLWLSRRWKSSLFVAIYLAIALRFMLHQERSEIQSLAYWTIVGRLDQFLLGMLAFQYRHLMARRHLLAVGVLCGFSLFYWYFDGLGGFYKHIFYPSPSQIWVILPTLEGLVYAFCIAWYDNSFSPSSTGLSRFIGRIGTYSYSIYLFHFFFVFEMARLVDLWVMDISNFYLACLWALICFVLMAPLGYLSYRYIEAPFLKLRRRYTIERGEPASTPPLPSTTPPAHGGFQPSPALRDS